MRLINADALKEEIGSWGMNDYEPSDFIDAIDEAHTVETDIEVVAKDAYEHGYADGWKERFGEPDGRPQGEWVNTSPYDDKGECPLCCYLSKKYYKFCPNCGARMVKDNEKG